MDYTERLNYELWLEDMERLEELRAGSTRRLEDIYGVCPACGLILNIDGDCVAHAPTPYDGLYIED